MKDYGMITKQTSYIHYLRVSVRVCVFEERMVKVVSCVDGLSDFVGE